MSRLQCERRCHIRNGLLRGLLRQPIHQIQIEIAEPGRVQFLGRANRFSRRVNAAERRKLACIETLRTQRDPIDTGGAVAGKPAALDRAWIGFKRNFGIGGNSEQPAHLLDETADGIG